MLRSRTTTMLLRERKQQVRITCVWLFQQRPYEQFYKLLFATSGEIRRITLNTHQKFSHGQCCSRQLFESDI